MAGLRVLHFCILSEGNDNLEFKLIDYCNSGDSPYGNKTEVVGYNAMAMIEKKQINNEKQSENEVSFTDKEKKLLFTIVRNSISSTLNGNKTSDIDVKSIPDKLKLQMGAFVTLKIHGTLRGCIGRFTSSDPLYEVVKASALSSAFEDHRFSPLTKDEYKNIDIEITVLGPLKKINNINEIILGKHGIYIKKGFQIRNYASPGCYGKRLDSRTVSWIYLTR